MTLKVTVSCGLDMKMQPDLDDCHKGIFGRKGNFQAYNRKMTQDDSPTKT